ncbi:SDR family oxidoreductase [Rhodocytophaga aerolata]|uniref:SDR family oxidoreductase n=1 Tax=Rhodocytophaga aerolata TaxID=455078 RepID=A0ABT8RCY2_9BACT|nr:SDR family oxidoreductase [Rhodocytophaga aerolata]MDO1448540.1 SDR family oxidoreductase [Rhodocytophaga aerolata]
MQKLKGQSALVTGASSGIGKAIAIELGRAGAQVIVNYHSSEDGAKDTVKEIEAAGGKAIAIKADVSKEDQVQRMFKQMFEAFGTIDILINNSGLQKDAPFLEMSLDDWQKVIDINLTGQFLCAREAAREFVRRGVVKERSVAAGKIICISSVHEVIPWAGHVNYAASKGGIMLFMKSIAQELAPLKIRVNSIAPGAIKTPINNEAWETKEAEKKLLELIPYGRVGETLDVAKAAVWLASDESDYIHGVSLLIDGGMALYPGFADNG